MYEAFYKLSSRPFMTAPDPSFLYWSETHSLAFTMLTYGIQSRAQITVLTGDIGSGKTTLLRKLLSEMPEELEIGLISNMQTGRGELLHWVMMALGHTVDGTPYVEMFQRFQRHLVDAYAAGRRVVLIFDEAQNMAAGTLEELRLLSNINTENDELLQIILVGQPQLRDLLNQPALVQFAQRVGADFRLRPLTEDETLNYIEHRLHKAGAQWRILTPEACRRIHKAARGVPRLINSLCDLMLVYGLAAERHVVHEDLVEEFLCSSRRHGIYNQFDVFDHTPQRARLVE